MDRTIKPVGKTQANPPKKTAAELDEKELEKVAGGKPCAGGEHIKEGVITTR